jgi:hypothetical protein
MSQQMIVISGFLEGSTRHISDCLPSGTGKSKWVGFSRAIGSISGFCCSSSSARCIGKSTAVLAPGCSYSRASQSGHDACACISVMLVNHVHFAKARTQAKPSQLTAHCCFSACLVREGARILPYFSGIMVTIYAMTRRFWRHYALGLLCRT